MRPLIHAPDDMRILLQPPSVAALGCEQSLVGAAEKPGQAGAIALAAELYPDVVEALQRTAHLAGDDITIWKKKPGACGPESLAGRGIQSSSIKKLCLAYRWECSATC